MTAVTVTLGEFTFAALEARDKINFGGDQRLVVHELVGGVRVVDAMGAQPANLSWRGIMVGESAIDRARYLDTQRKIGAQQVCAWSVFRYTVVIRRFAADFQAPFRIPFEIELEVVEDLTQRVLRAPESDSDRVINADMSAVGVLGNQIGDAPLSGLISGLDTAISKVSHFATTARREIASVLDPLRAVQARVNLLRAAASNALINVSSFGGLVPGNPVAQAVRSVNRQIVAATQAPVLQLMDGRLSRMALNIASAPTGPKRVTVAGTDLYAVAAAQYADALAWTTLARANGLTDPSIPDVRTLAVPKTKVDTGGVLTA